MIKQANANSLFEGMDVRGENPETLMKARKLYNYIVESAEIAKEQNMPLHDVIDEGLFGAIIGGTVSATIGKSIMEAIIKVLGIDANGTLGKLLTSQVVLAAMGAQLGYNW